MSFLCYCPMLYMRIGQIFVLVPPLSTCTPILPTVLKLVQFLIELPPNQQTLNDHQMVYGGPEKMIATQIGVQKPVSNTSPVFSEFSKIGVGSTSFNEMETIGRDKWPTVFNVGTIPVQCYYSLGTKQSSRDLLQPPLPTSYSTTGNNSLAFITPGKLSPMMSIPDRIKPPYTNTNNLNNTFPEVNPLHLNYCQPPQPGAEVPSVYIGRVAIPTIPDPPPTLQHRTVCNSLKPPCLSPLPASFPTCQTTKPFFHNTSLLCRNSTTTTPMAEGQNLNDDDFLVNSTPDTVNSAQDAVNSTQDTISQRHGARHDP